jgi:rubrerythrin
VGIRFNADEVFEMAIRAEQNAGTFYRKAAELHGDDEGKELLNGLAAMEDEHEKTFTKMREELTAKESGFTVFDPEGESALYLAAMVNSRRVEGAPSMAADMTGDEKIEDLIRVAIGLEKEAILFYLGLSDVVSEKQGKQKVMDIIEEEKGHVVDLTEKLGELSGS